MNENKYRNNWLKANKLYEKKAYKMFKESFVKMTLNIPFNVMTATNYEAMINISAINNDIEKTYVQVYTEIGLIHGGKVGKGINKDIKDFNPLVFESEFIKSIYKWVIENVGYRIVSVTDTYIKFIKEIIANGFKEGKTVDEISRDIHKMVRKRNFYRWQSLRIARTETSAAANRGASIAGTTSGIVLEDVWISATDARTRRKPKSRYDHYEMNMKRVPHKAGFNVNGEIIPFPASPTTMSGARSSGQNVVNCRCTIAVVAKKDKNGRAIRI